MRHFFVWPLIKRMWLALLALGLVWLMLPLGTLVALRVIIAIWLLLLVLTYFAKTISYQCEQSRRRLSWVNTWQKFHTTVADAVTWNQRPWVFVGGSAAAYLFSPSCPLRLGQQAVWLHIVSPTQLVESSRAASHFPIGLVLLTEQGCCCEETLIAWRDAIESLQRCSARSLPVAVVIAIDLGLPAGAVLPNEVAQQCIADLSTAQRYLLNCRTSLDRWPMIGPAALRWQRLISTVHLHATLAWCEKQLIQYLLSARRRSYSLHASWIGWLTVQRTQTTPFITLPEALLATFLTQRNTPSYLALGYWLLGWLGTAFALASAAAAWNNWQLIDRVHHHLQTFKPLATRPHTSQAQAFEQLVADRTELQQHAQQGVPLYLGLGLYQGGSLLTAINRSVAAYRSPKPQVMAIQINNIVLFKHGSAQLAPKAKLDLQALVSWLATHASQRVLIDGHTDDTGNPAINLRLSLARATVVQQWLAMSSALPITHFSVRGYGNTQPITRGTDKANRARNRRVEISVLHP